VLANASNNFFYGNVNAPGGAFGFAADVTAPAPTRARDGRLTDQDVEAALDHYVRPAPFAAAAEILAKDGLAVLAGPPGIGKATSAIALLREVTKGPLALLSPTVSLRQLAGRDFTAVPGFVVMDWQYDRSGRDIDEFTWRMLREQLRDATAYLLITTTTAPRASVPGLVGHFTWEQPSAGEVISVYLTGTQHEALIEDVAAQVPDQCRIGPIVTLARRLADGEEPAAALDEVRNDAADRVRQWFEKPSPAEILEVISLAFAAGLSERGFETMLGRLATTIKDAGYTLDADAAGQIEPVRAPKLLRPARADRGSADGLISRETLAVDGAAVTVVRFRDAGYRLAVLAELSQRYDATLWDAVRVWLEDTVTDSGQGRNAGAQITVAEGLAALAQVDMSEVEDSYLDPWAAGWLGAPGQLVAAYALWCLCFDGDLAATALHIATKWATTGDPARRWTAAIAFSGELGLRYPTQAANRLWHLIAQSADSTEARFALARLFATMTARGQSADRVLALLGQRLDDAGRGRRDPRQQNLIMLTALTVLAVRDGLTGIPSITMFLRANPGRLALAGRLLTSVLRYRPLRRSALAVLIDAVSSFDNVSDAPEQDARALGRALAQTLRPGEHEQLATDLLNHQAHAKRRRHDVDAIMRALLAALERLNNTEPGEPQ
jgi:hypothetical protein